MTHGSSPNARNLVAHGSEEVASEPPLGRIEPEVGHRRRKRLEHALRHILRVGRLHSLPDGESDDELAVERLEPVPCCLVARIPKPGDKRELGRGNPHRAPDATPPMARDSRRPLDGARTVAWAGSLYTSRLSVRWPQRTSDPSRRSVGTSSVDSSASLIRIDPQPSLPSGPITIGDETVLSVQDPVLYVRADLDGNGSVDGADLGALLVAWGPCGGWTGLVVVMANDRLDVGHLVRWSCPDRLWRDARPTDHRRRRGPSRASEAVKSSRVRSRIADIVG